MQVGEQTNEVAEEVEEVEEVETTEILEMAQELDEEQMQEPLEERAEEPLIELLEAVLGGDGLGTGQKKMLGEEELLLETLLDDVMLGPEAPDVVSEIGTQGGNEVKLRFVLLHSDTVVMLDVVDVVPAVSVLGRILGREFVVG